MMQTLAFTSVDTENSRKRVPTKKKSGQEKWDELLQTPESEALLTLLVAQAKREEEEGNFDEGDW